MNEGIIFIFVLNDGKRNFLKNFESFFRTLWQAYLNICLCFGVTDSAGQEGPIFKTVCQRV